MFADITERKRAEEQQSRLQREVSHARKLQALGQLTGGIAHDFNNILGIIMGYTALSLKKLGDKPNAILSHHLETVMSASERARSLIAKMLTYSRNDPPEVKRIELASVIRESVDMLHALTPSSIEVTFVGEENLPDVAADTDGLQQVIMNLCLNARDAMHGSGRLDIRVSHRQLADIECATCHLRVSGDWSELSVTDIGDGIPADAMEHVFEPFYTTKEIGQGSGMGLAVVQGVVERHGAHMLVESTPGRGSVFRALFHPLAQSSRIEPPTPAARTTAPDHPVQGRVMVVDDEPELAGLIADVLEDHGLSCKVFTNSDEALEYITANALAFVVVVTDQTMPKLPGVALIERLRGLGIDIPVILSTGYSEEIDAGRAAELGVEFLKKPVDPERLGAAVANPIDRYRATPRSAGAG